MEGWTKLHRRFLKWEWYDKSEMVHLFIHLLLSANHEDGKWRGIPVKRGQLITGLNTLKKETGISIQTLRTCLTRLQKTGEIGKQSNNKLTVITITNYESYQTDERKPNKQPNKLLTSNQQATNNKQELKNKKNKKNIDIPSWDDFRVFGVEKKPKVDKGELKLKYESWVENDWKDGKDNPIKNWRSKLLNTLPYIKEKVGPEPTGRKERSTVPENFGVPSPTAKPMPDHLKKKISQIGQQ